MQIKITFLNFLFLNFSDHLIMASNSETPIVIEATSLASHPEETKPIAKILPNKAVIIPFHVLCSKLELCEAAMFQ